jgi:hypothetical protein
MKLMSGMTEAYLKAWRSFSTESRTVVTSAINMAIIITSANTDTAIIHPMDMADTAGKNQKKFIDPSRFLQLTLVTINIHQCQIPSHMYWLQAVQVLLAVT